MDFDIGNLVYIVLTLIFLIVGALGQKKKPNPQVFESYDEDQEEQGDTSDPIEEKFSRLFGEDDEAVRQREEIERRTYKEESEREDYLLDTPYDKIDDLPPEYDEVFQEKDEDKIYKLEDHIEEIAEKTRLQMIPHKKKDVSFVKKALRDFEPRKAYLYSEIFNPKYF